MTDRFTISNSGMVHDLQDDLGYIITNQTNCGQKVRDDWESIDANNIRELVVCFRPMRYCSNCFSAPHKLRHLEDKCNNDVEYICEVE